MISPASLDARLTVAPPRSLLAGRDPLRLEPDTIHVWAFTLDGDAELVERCRGLLAEDERRRADRFVFDRDRIHHTVAHALLRHLLSRYCGATPESLCFKTSAAGKPVLQTANLPAHAATLHFNLTHSENRALLGVSDGRELGIDVERARTNIEALAISRHYFFGSERDAIERSATPDHTFFRYWVAKEAVLKAQGIGLGFPLDRFRVAFSSDGNTARIESLDPAKLSDEWTVRMLSCENDWLAAVAARGTDWIVKPESGL